MTLYNWWLFVCMSANLFCSLSLPPSPLCRIFDWVNLKVRLLWTFYPVMVTLCNSSEIRSGIRCSFQNIHFKNYMHSEISVYMHTYITRITYLYQNKHYWVKSMWFLSAYRRSSFTVDIFQGGRWVNKLLGLMFFGSYNVGAPPRLTGLRRWPWTTMSLLWIQLGTFVAHLSPSFQFHSSFYYCNVDKASDINRKIQPP